MWYFFLLLNVKAQKNFGWLKITIITTSPSKYAKILGSGAVDFHPSRSCRLRQWQMGFLKINPYYDLPWELYVVILKNVPYKKHANIVCSEQQTLCNNVCLNFHHVANVLAQFFYWRFFLGDYINLLTTFFQNRSIFIPGKKTVNAWRDTKNFLNIEATSLHMKKSVSSKYFKFYL